MSQTDTLRAAGNDDHTDILAVIEEVAAEIPVSLDTEVKKEAMKTIIVECCASGDSMVVEDENGVVVGFVLAKPDKMERFHHNNDAISLRYIGVGNGARRRGIFANLMAAYLARNVPITASVLAENKGEMLRRLTGLGFAVVKETTEQTDLKHSPQ